MALFMQVYLLLSVGRLMIVLDEADHCSVFLNIGDGLHQWTGL